MNQQLKELLESKKTKVTLAVLLALFVILLAFNAGMAVGFRKARFSYEYGDNYHKNFAGPSRGFGDDMRGDSFLNSHGSFGEITEIASTTLVIKAGSEPEKVIAISSSTEIRRFRDRITLPELETGDKVVVVGEPNDSGQIEAKLIRVIPSPSTNSLTH